MPVKYRAVGSFDNTDIRAKAHVSWLFHLFALHIEYADETDGYIRLVFVKKGLFADSLGDNYEAFNDDVMDDAAKTETEDKVRENTGDEPEIPADSQEHITDEQTENESTAQTHKEQRTVNDENQHIKQQTKLTHKKCIKSHTKSHIKSNLKDKSE